MTRRNEELSRDALGVRGYETLGANEYRLCACALLLFHLLRREGTFDGKNGRLVRRPRARVFRGVASRRRRGSSPNRGGSRALARRRRRFRVRASRVRDGGIFRDAHRSFRAGRSRGRAHVEREGRGRGGVSGPNASPRHFDGAAALCPRVLRGDASAWERWVFHFAHARALRSLAPYLPTENPTLHPTAYEVVLHAFLADAADHARFLACVRSWPPRLYGVPALVAATRRRIGDAADAHARRADANADAPRNADASDSSEISSFDSSSSAAVLKEALAELYLADGQRERALALHLELGRPGVLDFIARHGLLAAAKDRIPRLAAMDRPARRRFSSTNAAPSRRTSSPRHSRTPPRRASEARGTFCTCTSARSSPRIRSRARRGTARRRGSTPNSTRRNCSISSDARRDTI